MLINCSNLKYSYLKLFKFEKNYIQKIVQHFSKSQEVKIQDKRKREKENRKQKRNK